MRRNSSGWILLEPTLPIPAGWCQFVLEIEGEIHNPRVYFDFGGGFRESDSVMLDSSTEQGTCCGVTFLHAPVRHLRLDPSDEPDRFRLKAFHVDPLFPEPSRHEPVRRRWNGLPAEGTFAQRKENAHVVFARRSHLSGVSVRLDPSWGEEVAITLELHADDGDGVHPLRCVVIDPAKIDPGEMEHLYWEPVEKSKGRFFFLHARPSRDGARPSASTAPRLLEVKLIHSQPQAYVPLPQALLFSPVSQCNLNCTHCISRPTRSKLRIASEATWDAVQEITRGEDFVHLATDYSGDILFDERRYPGTLARIIALDAKFRIDTHANNLDDDIVDMLLESKLWEINFSIDSMDPDVYRSIRRGSIPLAEVLAKIARFMSRMQAARNEIHTIISFVLMRSNAATIKPALAFARENGIDHVSVVPLLAFTEEMLDEIFVWDEVAFARLHEELMTEAIRLGVALAFQPPVQRWREEDIHAPCEVPWGTVAITGNGDVMACCMPGTVVGNLNEESLEKIWSGPRFADFRMRINTPNPPAPCRNCGMSRVHNNRRAYAPVRYALPAPAAVDKG
jgi:radical SAM protein with 4Fe4S-binding SPASM domain